MGFKSLLASLLLVSAASAQLTGHVGPTTALSAKQVTICNVLNYGGTVGSADIGPAISSAFTVCFTGTLSSILLTTFATELRTEELRLDPLRTRWYVITIHLLYRLTRRICLSGNYNMKTWVTLNGGTKWAFRLDGLITRTGMYHTISACHTTVMLTLNNAR